MLVESINFSEDHCIVRVRVSNHLLKTSQIEGFADYLLEELPGLSNHHCHNYNNQPFTQELKDTELAHVLEHVLIELITLKDKSIRNLAGSTAWNWRESPRGTYDVEIACTNKYVVKETLAQSIALIASIAHRAKETLPVFNNAGATILAPIPAHAFSN